MQPAGTPALHGASVDDPVLKPRAFVKMSILPPGLLYTLTAEEAADLLGRFGAK